MKLKASIDRVDLFLVFGTLVMVLLTWTAFEVTESSYISSAMNGITTSISLVISSEGAIIALSVSKSILSLETHAKRFQITLSILGLSATVMFCAYVVLLGASPQIAIKISLTVLIVVVYLFVDTIGFLIQHSGSAKS